MKTKENWAIIMLREPVSYPGFSSEKEAEGYATVLELKPSDYVIKMLSGITVFDHVSDEKNGLFSGDMMNKGIINEVSQ